MSIINKYNTAPRATTVVGNLNAVLGLLDSDVMDHEGVLITPEVPEGLQLAGLVQWNVTKDQVVEWAKALPDTGYFEIAGNWVDV